MYDKGRNFLFLDAEQIVGRLRQLGMTLVETEDPEIPDGVLRCTDFRQIDCSRGDLGLQDRLAE